jgi:prepilin peptidase CpaA
MIEYALLIVFPFLVIYAAASDFFSMTISNKVALGLMGSFVVFAYLMGMDLQTFGWHWAAFGLVLVCGFTLFAVGVMGGGDVKLAASTALWFGWEHMFEYFILTSILGAVLTLFFVVARERVMPEAFVKMDWFARLYNSNQIPYGIALGFAALLIYPETQWMKAVFSSFA